MTCAASTTSILAARSDQGVPREPISKGTYDGVKLFPGDVLLIEAPNSAYGCPVWLRDFSLVRPIAHSSPPRLGTKGDRFRIALALGGMAIAIILYILSSALDVPELSLSNLLAVLVFFLLVSKSLTLEDLYSSIDIRILLVIAGALPLGYAISSTGLASWAASGIVSISSHAGKVGIMFGIHLVTALLSLFVANAAVIAIMAPIAVQIAAEQQMPVNGMICLVTLATSATYGTPIAHQTNLMVNPACGYSWGSYMKFGGLLQFVHMFVNVGVCLVWGLVTGPTTYTCTTP
mmetsp:Transcript_36665/g.82531  ORF Transcript_36665/g.82531 Transcript_36665/m.82531 type:complete len:291 (+) Transcript_36665:1824-2696(+)